MAPDIWFPNLGIELFNVSRVAFSIFGFSIYWYAVLIILGILTAYAAALIEVRRTGQRREDYTDILVVGLPFVLVGLRLFYVIFNWELFRDNPLRIITGIREGGLAIFGGIIVSIIVVYVFSIRRKLNVWLVLDVGAPSFALGQAIGRWGNFINLEAFGGFTDNLFAMRIVRDQTNMPLTPEILANTVLYNNVEYIQVHPTFLYESLWSFGLFAILTIYRPRKKFNGQIFWLYLLGYGFGRFFIESLRTDQLLMGSVPVSQAMAALLVVSAVIAMALQKFVWLKG